TIRSAVLALLLVLAVKAVCAFFQSLCFNYAGERAAANLRRDTFARLVRLPMQFFGERRSGELANRLAADFSQIQEVQIFTGPQLMRQSLLLVGGLTLLTVTSPRLAGVMLLCVPVAVIAAMAFGKKIRGQSRAAQDLLAETATVAEETLQAMATVKAFN